MDGLAHMTKSGVEALSPSAPSLLSGVEEETVEVSVPAVERRKESGDKSMYVVFNVCSRVNNAFGDFERGERKVWRRYNDFVALNTHMGSVHETIVLPPLPPTRGFSMSKLVDSLDAEFIDQRRLALQRYLRALIEHPILGKDFELAVFLQHEEFERGDSKSFSKTDKVVVGVMHNLKVKDMDPRISDLSGYADKLRDCLKSLNEGFESLNDNIMSQIESYRNLRSSMVEFGNNEEELRDVITTFCSFLEKLTESMATKLKEEKEVFLSVVNDYILYASNIDTVVKLYQSKQLQYSGLVDALNRAQEKKALLERETEKILAHHEGRPPPQAKPTSENGLTINTGFASFSNITKMFSSIDTPEVHRHKIENKVREIDNTTVLVRKTHASNLEFVDKVIQNMKYFHEKKEADLRAALKRYATIQDGFYRQSVSTWENIKALFENM